MRNWWTTEDRQHFKALATQFVTQYQAYSPLPGQFINGQLTLAENIADNLGLQLAYEAYQRSLKDQEAPVIDGLTGKQRFFISFAQMWRAKITDAELLRRRAIDDHSPDFFRPTGAIVNYGAFFQAFNIQAGDRMFKPVAERINIW